LNRGRELQSPTLGPKLKQAYPFFSVRLRPVVTSGEANAIFASHLSNVPSIPAEAFTENLIELAIGTTSKTGSVLVPYALPM
jgi:hypothetical protein